MPGTMVDPIKCAIGTYSRPILKVYGDVKTLTASGTSGGKEGGTPTTCDGNLAKRPC